MSDRSEQHLSVLISVPNEIEANSIVAALEERGIRAEAAGGLTSGFRAEAPGSVNVLVHEEDFVQAQAILRELRDEWSSIDWSQVDLGESEL